MAPPSASQDPDGKGGTRRVPSEPKANVPCREGDAALLLFRLPKMKGPRLFGAAPCSVIGLRCPLMSGSGSSFSSPGPAYWLCPFAMPQPIPPSLPSTPGWAIHLDEVSLLPCARARRRARPRAVPRSDRQLAAFPASPAAAGKARPAPRLDRPRAEQPWRSVTPPNSA